jgi:hypothetical protein
MMKTLLSVLSIGIILLFLAACSGTSDTPQKKVLVMISGKAKIEDNIITLEPGTTHTENLITASGDKLTIKSPSGSTDITVPDAGLYILNLKKDTLVGSFQRVGSENSQEVITQDNLKLRIDSLNRLMAGTNTNTANRNFCIPPNQIMKVSANTKAEIIGPYKTVPGSFAGGKEHEIYKFYTNKEMQEIVRKLTKMAEPEPAE